MNPGKRNSQALLSRDDREKYKENIVDHLDLCGRSCSDKKHSFFCKLWDLIIPQGMLVKIDAWIQ
jgi:hypothetical protein